jgi:1-deoxy-D-xylulose-5-phosphate reductoisomerase
MKRIAILGSTGSIGESALSVVATHADRIQVVGLAAGSNVERFAEQVRAHRPAVFTMASESALRQVGDLLGMASEDVSRTPAGSDGLVAVATHPDVDLVLCATSGTAALDAVLAAIEAGKTIALANKEVLVMAGALMMRAAETHRATVLPVDSEHNAIHQCLAGTSRDDVKRLVLTASGGPFRAWPADKLSAVTPAQALEHPTWNMGQKITIDSSTLMNKGLEVIEARWLFDVSPGQIDVVVHPQSVVHSMVELRDGSVIAQLGVTDMRLPIQYAFSYPERWNTTLPALDLAACGRLDFDEPDRERFPCLGLAYQALEGGPAIPAVLNAANEVAVEAFLAGKVPFLAIPGIIEQSMEEAEKQGVGPADTLEGIRGVDAWARRFSKALLVGVESR